MILYEKLERGRLQYCVKVCKHDHIRITKVLHFSNASLAYACFHDNVQAVVERDITREVRKQRARERKERETQRRTLIAEEIAARQRYADNSAFGSF